MHRKSVDGRQATQFLSADVPQSPVDGVRASESLLQHVHIVMPPHANHMVCFIFCTFQLKWSKTFLFQGNMFGGIYMECTPPSPT
jgi:hypothetical protein